MNGENLFKILFVKISLKKNEEKKTKIENNNVAK